MKQTLQSLRAELKKAANPEKAPQMRAYMKSDMPFYGVPSPLVKQITKNIYSDFDFTEAENVNKAVLHIWREAKYREERYCALQLCAHKKAVALQSLDTLAVYEEIITDGAWWDYVDEISGRVGELLRKYPAKMKPKMLQWSKSDNMWKRRVSIICQRHFKKDTDLKLLYACIENSMGSKEFFLQKGIGWALREYAWVDAKEITRYVKANEKKLAPLSKREALKNVK